MTPEPITNQDGDNKNDCESKAFKRFWRNFKKEHPKLNVVVVADALYTNATILSMLQDDQARFIMAAKPTSHPLLFNYVNGCEQAGNVGIHVIQEEIGDKIKKTITRKFRYKNRVPLSNNYCDNSLNFLEYWETIDWIDTKGVSQKTEHHFSWVTNINIHKKNLMKLMRGGRARWSIENEVFNTLKNQGYNLEHNYGHGEKFLLNNFALLMMLAFFIDQLQEMSCKTFKRLLAKLKAKYVLWELIRLYFYEFTFLSWWDLLNRLAIKRCGGANSS